MKDNNLGELQLPKIIPTVVQVTDVVKGEVSTENITIIQSELFEDQDTKTDIGDKYILLLKKAPQENTYVATHHQAAYYKVTPANQIETLYQGQDFQKLNGLQVNRLKSEIQTTLYEK